MKGSPREHSPNCSCTSCKSTRVPLKRSDGDGMDKLNIGKNIPLKERILLTKLTRVRADYDALRTELLSSSSDTEKADLRVRKHVKHPDGTDSSSTLLDIVDIVDRGATLNSPSECCSCCVCSSTDVESKRHKQKHGHRQHKKTISEGGEDVKHRKKGKSEMASKAESEPPTKLTEPKKAAEPKPKPKEKAVLKKALDTTTSKIKSVSCTCTLKFNGLIKESKAAVKKLRKEKKPKKEIEATEGLWIDEYNTGKIIRRPKELSRESYERIEGTKLIVKKQLKTGADKSFEKIKILESKAKIKDKARRSIEKFKESNTKLKANIKKSLEKVKPKIKAPPKPTKPKHEEDVKPRSPRSVTPNSQTESEIAFPVDKDTLEEFMKKHQNIKDWVCGPECIPKKCRPKKCLEILIRKKGHKTNQTPIKSKTIKHKKKITSSSTSTQAGGSSTTKVGPKTKVTPQKKNKKEGHKKPQINLSVRGKSKEGLERKILSKTKSATSSISVKSVKKGTTRRKGKRKKETSPERKRSVKSVTDVSTASSRSNKKPTTLTVVKSKVSCICVTPERKKSTKSMTVISRPSAKLSQSVSLAKKPEIKHRTRKIKAEHKKIPVSRSSTPTSSTVSIIQKPRAHRSPKHKTKKIKATHVATKQKTSVKSLTAVKSNVSCTCATPERKKSTKSMTIISRPSAKKPEIKHRTRRIKAEHKKRPVSRSTTPTSPTVSITQKPRVHRSPTHKTKQIKATHTARSTSSQSTAIVPVKLHKKPAPYIPKKVKTHKSYTGPSQSRTAIPRPRPVVYRPKIVTSRSITVVPHPPKPRRQQKVRPHRPKSIASQGITAVSQPRKPRPQSDMRPDPILTATSNERQAVRISSTFSFDIEFYKNKPDVQDERIEPKKSIRDIGTGKKKPIKHRYSQQTVATSRQSTAINSLRRCFCTLKLGKPNKIKIPNAKHVSKGSEISLQSIETIPSQHVSRTVATVKREKDRYRQRKLLPYECEPDVCVPNSCYPYECIKLINKREGQHLKRRTRHSTTSNHKTRSTSSFASSNVHHKTKRVQSTVFTYKTEVPARKYQQTVTTITKPPRRTRTSPSSMSRQAVRIGSSFSFSIEFHKNRPSVASDVPVKKVHRREITRKEVRERAYRPESPKLPKKKHPKQVKAKASEIISHMNPTHQRKSPKKVKTKASESHSHLNAKHQQKSISMKTQQTGNISTAIVKCFCNLRWKKAKPKKKAAQTIAKEELKVATVGTETKRKKYKLKPYECEPYICIPGECDPYECLERRKKRIHSGTSPERIRTRSVSSTFYSSTSRAAIGTVRPRVKRKDTSTKRKKIRNISESISPTLVSRPIGTAPTQIHLIKRPVAAPARQAVRIGSTFSFDIEFYKNRPSAKERVIIYPSSERQIHESLRQMKERKKEYSDRGKMKSSTNVVSRFNQESQARRNKKSPAQIVPRSTQESQAATTKKRVRNIAVKPILKRCFCTLQLQKELRKKQKPTANIYTVSRVTVGETRITAQRRLMSYQYKHSTLGHEYELHRSREITIGNTQYIHPDSSAYTKPSSSESNMVLKQKQSTQYCHEGQLSNERSFQLKFWGSYSTMETPEKTELDSLTSFVTLSKSKTEPQSGKQNRTPKFIESSEHKTSFSFSRSIVSSISPVLRPWFYTMYPYMSNKNKKADKLSHEYRQGVVSPNICGLGQCKHIMKRLMKKSSRISYQSTATRSKSLCTNKKGSLIKAKNRPSRPNLTMYLQTEALSSFPQVIKSVPIHFEKQDVFAISNCSFNMEYDKTKQFLSRLPCPPRMIQPVLDSTSIKYVNQTTNKRTTGNNVHIDHSNSKSTEKFEAKTSHNITPFKRCPCTMNLQNKWKRKDSSSQNTTTNSINIKHEIKPQTSGVRPNTKPLTSFQVYRLDPNECDPGICTPGSCSPHECLKLINLRNIRYQNQGLSTATVGAKSVQSHTKKRHRKERQVQHHATSRKHRANVIREIHTRSVSPTKVASPRRQVIKHESGNRRAVKIGSTYSFDLEFYKDSSRHSAPTVIKEVRPAPKASRNKSKAYAPRKQSDSTKSYETKSTTRTVGRRRALHTRKSQIHTNKHDHKTGPSKLKRCFCTLELQKKGRHPVHAPPYKIEKPAKNQYTSTVPYKPIATAHSRSVVAKEKTKKRPKLLPYECEPGVCVSGSCSPIKCLERIKRRNLKEMGTDVRRPRSESTKTSNTTRTRAKHVQRHHERPKTAHSTATTKAPKQKKLYRERVMTVPTHKVIDSSHSSSDRQAVRIGTSFNFNIELFKDRGGEGSHESITKGQKVYHPPPPKKVKREVKTRPSRMKPPKTRHVKSYRPKNIRSMQSQAVAKHVRNKLTEVKPILKRCFCTLKLQNRKKDEEGKSTKSKTVKKTVKNLGSTVSRKPHKDKKQNQKEHPNKTIILTHENVKNVGLAVSKKPHKDKKIYQIEQPHTTNIHKHEEVENFSSAVSKKLHKDKKIYQKEQPHKTIIHKHEKVKIVGSAVSKKPNKDKKIYQKEQPHKTKIHKYENRVIASTSTIANLKVIMPPKASVHQRRTTTKNTRKHKVLKLEPYECEPGVCTPGQCNPYECLKRIKNREMKATKSGTHHYRGRTTSSDTTRTANQRGGQTTGRHHKYHRQSQMTTKKPLPHVTPERHLVEQSRFKSTSSSLRQAVRISSSFSFNVEFYKETPSSYKSIKTAKPTPVKIIKKEHHEPKRQKSHASLAPKKRIRHQSAHVHEKQIKHHGAQHKSKTVSKGAGIRPLLQRCFCTLALKKGEHKQKATKHAPKTFESKTVATKTRKERKPKVKEQKDESDTATVGVATKKKIYLLKPYECEPFVCVPGQCDPYKCDKRIRRRMMKDCGTGDRPCKNQCAVTYTPKDGTFRCIDTQCDMKRKHRTKSTATIASRPPKPHPVPQYRKPPKQNVIQIPKNTQRQSIMIGSSYGFDIEFFKDRIPGSIAKEKVYIPKEKHLPRPGKVKQVATRKLPKNTTGTGKSNNHRDQKHGAGVATDHKGTGMSTLKRCFCTLKLQKALAPPLNVMRVEVQHKAATQTKYMRDKKEKSRKLAPYECEPGYCIPDECDPWKCLERMRRKLYKEQGTGTHVCDQGTKCIAAKCIPTWTHQNTQYNLKHGKKYTQKTECVPTQRPKQMPRPGIVDVPRFPKFRQGVKIGSNMSCSIEFYKETIPPSFEPRYKLDKIHRLQEPKQRNKPPKQPKMVQECPALKHAKTGYSSKRCSKDVQAECTKKAHKGIDAGKMLKRCFCTLKLQDTAAYKKMYTVGRVAVLEDRRNPYLVSKETENKGKNSIGSKLNTYENFILPSRLDCNCYDCLKLKENLLICKITHTANKTDSMKTIFPYHPYKFNNNISNTLINNKNMRHQFPDNIYCSRPNYDRNIKHDILALKDSRKKDKKDKKSKKYKQPVQEKSENTLSNKFKGFIRRCMGLFKKSTTEKIVQNKVEKLPEHKPTERKKKNKRSKQEKKSDSNVLKTSKSDRHPTNAKIVSIPKTSKSVKVTKVSEGDIKFQEKGKKKYSRFQSGDTVHIQMNIPQDKKKLVKNRLEHTIQNLIAPSSIELNKNNNVMCYYSQMHYNDQINNFKKNRTPFMDHKAVQMATIKRCVDKYDEPNLCESTKNCPCSEKPVKAYKDQVHLHNFYKYKPPKYVVSKNPNYTNMMDLQGKCCSCEKPKKMPLVEPNIDQYNQNMTRTKPKPKAKHTNDEMDTCKTSKPCACCKGGRRKIFSLFRKKEIKDPDKKHVEFTLSKNKHGKCVVECKVASPKDVSKVKKALNKATIKKLVCDRTPILEMRLGSDDLRILNRDNVYDKINEIETMKLGRQTGAHYKNIESYGDLTTEQLIQMHGKSCSCCICMNRRKPDRPLQLLKGQKPCVCGSKPCARLSLKKATEAMARMKAERERRECPCGMDICNRETMKQDLKKNLISKKKAQKFETRGMTRKQLREQKRKRKEYLQRQKRYKIEDDERRARQRREERYLEQQVKKYEDTNDVLLVAESALDLTKLGVSTVVRTIRCICRSIFNYKNTIQSVKNAQQDPSRILTNVKGAFEDSGTRATFRRIRKRMESTRMVQIFQKRLENVPMTNFLVHAIDRDPKKRLERKKRRARRREPIEFECSLFMASLRKRPYLAVYYTCPWFYPHFVSMIGILKQFADAMLFLLAVVVWSPCILAMEICRTLMCCTLCTG